MKVKKNILYLLAGLFWLIAGVNVVRIGVDVMHDPESRLFVFLTLILIIFFLFFQFIFARIVRENVSRIEQLDDDRVHIWLFMDKKGYIIMSFMITLGVTVRYLNLLPDFFISFFYIGLGGALTLTAFKYIPHYFKK
ncbi:MAG: hypothetical protein ACRCSR_02680 [Bacteroidales bacterium]